MKPKEKANELVNKIINISQMEVYLWMAKDMALIAVDEILKDNPNIYDSDRLNCKYWQEVKQEIEKL